MPPARTRSVSQRSYAASKASADLLLFYQRAMNCRPDYPIQQLQSVSVPGS
jgi:hypothetical protein